MNWIFAIVFLVISWKCVRDGIRTYQTGQRILLHIRLANQMERDAKKLKLPRKRRKVITKAE